VPDRLDLSDEQVHGLGGPVGTVMGGVKGEELGLPGPHGASQPGQLGDLDTIAPVVEADQGGAGCWRANRCIL
jgi:hypothetical protein